MYPISFRAPVGSSSADKCLPSESSRVSTPVSTLAVGARLALCFGALAPFLSAPAHADATGTALASGQYVAGELLVKFKGGTSSVSAQQARARFGASVVKSYNKTGWQRIKLPVGVTTIKGLAQFSGLAGVVAVEPNYRVYPTATPNDPRYVEQYHHALIHTPQAWDANTGSNSIVVAVLDTGILATHQDLAPNLFINPLEIPDNGIDDDGNGYIDDVSGWNFVGEPEDESNDPDDDNTRDNGGGHGTHVAGIIGAAGNNSLGVTGVNWNVKILPLRFLGEDGGTSADELQCYEYMIGLKQKGVNLRVANGSYGGTFRSQAIEDAINLAGQNNILTVLAAGNGNNRGVGINNDLAPSYPTSLDSPYILSVAASDENNNITSFSNYGVRTVDIAAPGNNILSTYYGSDNNYTIESGTSMACPVVAGAAALVLAQNPDLNALSLKSRLMSTVTKLPQWKNKVASGGIVNVAQAVGGIFSISGTVSTTNSTTQAIAPLAGVTLTITETGATATTDTNGLYEFEDLPSGTYTVLINSNGYGSQSQKVTIEGADTTADFSLVAEAPTYALAGTVTQVVSGVNVPVDGVEIYLNSSPTASATTTSSGSYFISGLGAGTYSISAGKVGYTITVAGTNNASTTIDVPTASSSTATVNFIAVSAPDVSAPDVTIDNPEDGSEITFVSGGGATITARGSASDESGVAALSFVLARQNGRKLQYYNWTKRNWSAKNTVAGVIMTRTVSGATDVTWSQILPKLAKGTYILNVSGRDTLGNESDSTSGAISTFSVAKQARSNGKTASTSTSSVKGS